ncbi:GntR family transcriptional regulator [Falsiruegeria litorea]|uniref:GntR family transcriptional regulator n=1 Tax=Falsiruegeria litorea TaxID=1280831 RepID=UPI001BFDF66F|nr:GntR family transcriptional regulator [Falsiruegeria litorea]MBT8168095.1 GntR family transcriptional regulator [Falsiruegeria litorea]
MDKSKHDKTGLALIGASKSKRIAHALESEIRTGVLSRGDALASENALVKRFAVSRSTVRKSLEMLSSKGLITTKSGIGSFVTFDGVTIDDQAGWTLALSSSTVQLSTRVLRLERGPMDIQCAEIPLGTDCLIVDRLRYLGNIGAGVSLERSRVPWRDTLNEVLQVGLVDGSLNTTLQNRGLTIANGAEWAGVEPSLSADDAAVMGRKAGDAMLRLRRLTREEDRTIIEYVESILDPDLFGLHMEF